jgi:hypothetical protein
MTTGPTTSQAKLRIQKSVPALLNAGAPSSLIGSVRCCCFIAARSAYGLALEAQMITQPVIVRARSTPMTSRRRVA